MNQKRICGKITLFCSLKVDDNDRAFMTLEKRGELQAVAGEYGRVVLNCTGYIYIVNISVKRLCAMCLDSRALCIEAHKAQQAIMNQITASCMQR